MTGFYKSKLLKNILWLLFDKVFILFLQFFVGVKIANYYGSEIYGNYTYAMSIIAFSPVFLEIINARVVKKYYDDNDIGIVIRSVTLLKKIVSVFIVIICIVISLFSSNKELLVFLIILSINNMFIVSTFGLENYFEFKLESKYVVIANNLIKLVSYIFQFLLISMNYSIIYIPIVRLIGSFIRIFIIHFYARKLNIRRLDDRFDFNILRNIIVESRYLWISSISFIIYTKIDSIMIANILGTKEVGIYYIGLQLMKMTSILIIPYANSLFPKLLLAYKENNIVFEKMYVKYTCIITYTYLIILIISNIGVPLLFGFVFNKEYNQAIQIYFILSMTILIRAHYSLRGSYFTINNYTQIMLYGTLMGAFFNIILNFILIPIYGMNGAAIATVLSPLISVNIPGFIFKEGRKQLMLSYCSLNVIKLVKNRKV